MEPTGSGTTNGIARSIGPSADAADAKEARLEYRLLRRVERYSLLEVTLLTGRKHQIRVQLSSRGLPIVGDLKYGSRHRFPAGIALHAHRFGDSAPYYWGTY